MRSFARPAAVAAVALVTGCPVEQTADDYFSKWGDSASASSTGSSGSPGSTGPSSTTGSTPTTSGEASSGGSSSSGAVDASTGPDDTSTSTSGIGPFPIDQPPEILAFTVEDAAQDVSIFTPGPVELHLECVDDDGVQTIEFFRDGEPLAVGDPVTGLGEWVIHSHAFDGASQISARCTDTAGQAVETELPIGVVVALPEPGSLILVGTPPVTKGASEATSVAFDAETSDLWATGYQDAAIGGTWILLQRYNMKGELVSDTPIPFGKDVIGVAHGVAVLRDHGVVLVGCATKPNELPRAWFARYDVTGKQVWQQDGAPGECGLAVAVDEVLASVYVAGQQIVGAQNLDAVLRRLHLDGGGQQGIKILDGGDNGLDTAVAVAVEPSGDVYFGGTISSMGNFRAFIRRSSPNLNQVWFAMSPIAKPAQDGLGRLAMARDGAVLSTGWHRASALEKSRVFLRRHSPTDGSIDGLDTIEAGFQNGDNAGHAVATTVDDEPFVAATVTPDVNTEPNVWMKLYNSKYSPPGTWPIEFKGLAGRRDEPRGAAVGPWGHVAVAGFESVWKLDAMNKPVLRRQAWVLVLFP